MKLQNEKYYIYALVIKYLYNTSMMSTTSLSVKNCDVIELDSNVTDAVVETDGVVLNLQTSEEPVLNLTTH